MMMREASTTLIWETLNQLDLTFKNGSFTRPNRIGRMSLRRAVLRHAG